jgi:hypothetical protein
MYDKFLKKYLELNNTFEIPMYIQFYMLISPAFKKEVVLIQENLAHLKGDVPYKMRKDMTAAIMKQVYAAGFEYEQAVSSIKWFIAGFVIFASIVLIPFSDSMTWLKIQFGKSLEVPLSLVLGIAISTYAVLYIATHIELLKKDLQLLYKKMNWFD